MSARQPMLFERLAKGDVRDTGVVSVDLRGAEQGGRVSVSALEHPRPPSSGFHHVDD
jgi:hypothetical protein